MAELFRYAEDTVELKPVMLEMDRRQPAVADYPTTGNDTGLGSQVL